MHYIVPTDQLVEVLVITAIDASYYGASLLVTRRIWYNRWWQADHLSAINALVFLIGYATCSALLFVARKRSSPDSLPYIVWRSLTALCLAVSENLLLFRLTAGLGLRRKVLVGASIVLQVSWVALVLFLWHFAETSLEAVWASSGMTHLCLTALICKPLHLVRRLSLEAQKCFFQPDPIGLPKFSLDHWYLASAMAAITIGSLAMGACSFRDPLIYHFSFQDALVVIIIAVPLRKDVQALVQDGYRRSVAAIIQTDTEAGNYHDGVSQEHLLSHGNIKLSVQTLSKALFRN